MAHAGVRRLAAAGLGLAVLGLAVSSTAMVGCQFTPVSLEGRRCATTADCVSGYECSPELVCVLTPDVGRPDAGRPDAYLIDVGRDAFEPVSDAGSDAPPLRDATAGDASMQDDVGPTDGGAGTDGGSVPDAGADLDAARASDAPSPASDAGLDAAS